MSKLTCKLVPPNPFVTFFLHYKSMHTCSTRVFYCLVIALSLFMTVHIQNSAGETPIDVASRFAQLACVKLLKGDDSGK